MDQHGSPARCRRLNHGPRARYGCALDLDEVLAQRGNQELCKRAVSISYIVSGHGKPSGERGVRYQAGETL